ncbi:hypothetical protein, partial [Psychromonas aquatilis]
DFSALYSEELVAVIQVKREDKEAVLNSLAGHGLSSNSLVIGSINITDQIEFLRDGVEVLTAIRSEFRGFWAETT